jgi:hypothetical protein
MCTINTTLGYKPILITKGIIQDQVSTQTPKQIQYQNKDFYLSNLLGLQSSYTSLRVTWNMLATKGG